MPITFPADKFGLDVGAVNPLQFIDRGQPPVGVSCNAEIAAVIHCLAQIHVLAIVPRCPHESGRGISPIGWRLRFLCRVLILRRRWSDSFYGAARLWGQRSLGFSHT